MRRIILYVEDNQDLAEIVQDYLTSLDFTISHVSALEEAYEFLGKKAYDLLLLDINLPDGSGFQFLEELRERSQVPTIFLSARSSDSDRVEGFVRGGDDYLAKPFSLAELHMRILALLKRSYPQEENLSYASLLINLPSERVWKSGQELKLSPKEYKLLRYFMENPNRVLSKKELMDYCWGPYNEVEESSLSVHIRWLREKIEDQPDQAKLIKTVWGKGYMFHVEEH